MTFAMKRGTCTRALVATGALLLAGLFAPSPARAAGALAVGVITAPDSSNINLTAEGTDDWFEVGAIPLNGTTIPVNRKAGANKFADIMATTANPVSDLGDYHGDPFGFSWTDGTPAASASNTKDNTYNIAVGQGFSFTAPADTTTRVVRVYVGALDATGTLTAHLSDSSATDYTDSSFTTSITNVRHLAIYTIVYKAASAGQTLKVTWLLKTPLDGLGDNSLHAATLFVGNGIPDPPSNLTGKVGDTAIDLNWTGIDNSKGFAKGYSISRSDTAGGPYTQLATVSPFTTAYTDSGLTNAKTYYYVVKTLGVSGDSANSNEAALTPQDGPVGVGISGTYYSGRNFDTPVLTRVDNTIFFDWGNGSPDPLVPVDNFSVRWRGRLAASTTETYTFYMTSDDGSRLYVNGNLVIGNAWIDQGPTTYTATVDLTKGVRNLIVMEYYENGGGAVAKLEWSSPTVTRQPVPFAITNVSVAGKVTFDAAVNPVTADLRVELRPKPSGTAIVKTATPAADGSYSVSDIPPGTYDVAIKSPKYLQKVTIDKNATANVTDLNVTLQPGDGNNDNHVDIIDLGILADHYNTTTGDPDFDTNADYNNDGSVDIIDLGVLADNYNSDGDV